MERTHFETHFAMRFNGENEKNGLKVKSNYIIPYDSREFGDIIGGVPEGTILVVQDGFSIMNTIILSEKDFEKLSCLKMSVDEFIKNSNTEVGRIHDGKLLGNFSEPLKELLSTENIRKQAAGSVKTDIATTVANRTNLYISPEEVYAYSNKHNSYITGMPNDRILVVKQQDSGKNIVIVSKEVFEQLNNSQLAIDTFCKNVRIEIGRIHDGKLWGNFTELLKKFFKKENTQKQAVEV